MNREHFLGFGPDVVLTRLFPSESFAKFLDNIIVHLSRAKGVLEDWRVHDEDDVEHGQLTAG